jgi:hypothetical protein
MKILYYISNGKRFLGPHNKLTRLEESYQLYGDCTHLEGNVGFISGDVTGLWGNVSNLTGDVTGIVGNATGCDIPWFSAGMLFGDISYSIKDIPIVEIEG